MNSVWSQEISVCQGVKYTDMPWRCFKSEESVLFVCINLGGEFFQCGEELKIYTKHRIMFLSDTWEKKIQIFNKSYLL